VKGETVGVREGAVLVGAAEVVVVASVAAEEDEEVVEVVT
jgi:hypothetical protein